MSYGKSFYERKVRYLDYYEGQMRIGSGGFVKLEVREGKLRMDMSVTGLHVTDTFVRDVVLCGKGRERVAGRIDISGGKGRFRQEWQNLENIGDTGIGYGELQGIRIPLGPGREISGRWPETSMPAQKRPGAASSGGRRSGEGYAREVPGTWKESREEGRTRKGIDEERYYAGEAETEGYLAGEDGAEGYIAENAVAEQYGIEKAGGERGDRGVSIGAERTMEEKDIMLPSEQVDVVKGDSMKPKGSLESLTGIQDDMAVQTEDRGSQMKIIGEGFEEEWPVREMSEKERAAADRWKIEEDAETGDAPKEAEIRAMERGKGDMAKASRGEAYYSRGGHAVQEERKRRENGMSGMDSRGFGEHAADGSGEKREKPVYGTDSSRPGGYAVEGNGKIPEKSLYSKRGFKRKENPEQKQMKPMEDKWPQLWAIYPHIRPFQDEREYLSIGPADFVLFPAASYRSVNNSFLLHGYYNYKHLILARMERKGEVSYYIGVPGNFYEREKQVAIMFGFESFECAEEPAQVGDFGYYMMRTEL